MMTEIKPTEENSTGPGDQPREQKEVIASLQKIESELVRINSHKLVEVYNSVPKLVGFHFLKGVAFGLGSVMGATLVVWFVVFLLSQIEFIPVVGEWVKHIIAEIEK